MAGGYGPGSGGNMGGTGGTGGGAGGNNNGGNRTPLQHAADIAARNTAANSLRGAANAGAQARRAAAELEAATYSRRAIEDPCSLGNMIERVELETAPLDGEQEEAVEVVYPAPIDPMVFLVPDDEIRTNYSRVARTKTLVNQGLFFDVSESMMIIRDSGTSFLGFDYVRDLYEEYPESASDESMGKYGNLFPYLAHRPAEAYPGFYLYPIMSNLANEEARDEFARNNIDTLRYVLRRSWMRHSSGAAQYQKATPRTALESPFHFYAVASDSALSSRTRLNLLPKTVFFPDIPPAPFHFNHTGVTVQQGAELTVDDWNAFRFSKLDAYVLGPLHPDYESWNNTSKQVFNKSLIPLGVTLKDVVHDINMPFHEKELESLPPGRILDVKFRVGSNFITDRYREFNGSETSMRDIYSSYRMDKEGDDASNRSTAGEKVKFTTFNVSEFDEVAEQKKNQFPMYVNIEFSTHQGSLVSRYIKNSKLEEKVLDMMSVSFSTATLEERVRNTQYARSGMEDVYAEILDESVDHRRSRRRRRESPRENDRSVQGQERSTVDVMRWLESLGRPAPYVRHSIGYPLGLEPDEIAQLDSDASSLLFALRKARFSVAVNKLVQTKFRNYIKLLQGEKAYSETIGYKIEKYSVVNGVESLIQRFYILDNDETERINFVDSQVKYKGEYIYRIYAYNFVVGTKYMYSKISTPARAGQQEEERNLRATATIASFGDYVYDPSRPEYGIYRPVMYTGGEPYYADVFPKTPIPEDLVGGIQKLSVDHPLYEGDTPPMMWRQQLVNNMEPSLVGNPDRGVIIWTVPVSRGTIIGRPPREEEIMAEWENRQNAARMAANALVYPEVATRLSAAQTSRELWRDDVRAPSITNRIGSRVNDLSAENVFGHAPGGGGSLIPFYVDVDVDPHAVFIEVPFFEKRVVMEDAPPVFPQVHIVPFKGEEGVVRINLTSNSGEYMLEPVALNEEDQEIFDAVIQAQDPADGKIKFKSDDPPTRYEVFRTTEFPTSVMDFANSKIADVYAAGTGGVYDDAIEPNTIYYYIFRAVDSAGHISNPTEIYKCQIVSTENGMFLDVSTLSESDMMRDKVEKVSFAKSFVVKPALIQRLFQTGDQNRDLTGDEPLGMPPAGNPEIGLFEKSVWDKTYKIRLKSKNSGKTYDINLKFKKKVVDLTEPEQVDVAAEENPLNVARGEGSEISATSPVAGSVGGVDFGDDPGNRKF